MSSCDDGAGGEKTKRNDKNDDGFDVKADDDKEEEKCEIVDKELEDDPPALYDERNIAKIDSSGVAADEDDENKREGKSDGDIIMTSSGLPEEGGDGHGHGHEPRIVRPGAVAIPGIQSTSNSDALLSTPTSSQRSFTNIPQQLAPTLQPEEIIVTATLVKDDDDEEEEQKEEYELIIAERMPSQRDLQPPPNPETTKSKSEMIRSCLADKRVRFSLVILCFIVVGLVVAVSIVVTSHNGNNNDDASTNSENIGGGVFGTRSTAAPSSSPTISASPTTSPAPTSSSPTLIPTAQPSVEPTVQPTVMPTVSPTQPLWEQIGSDLRAPVGSFLFGYSISLNGNGTRLAIGAPGGFRDGESRVHVYQRASPSSSSSSSTNINTLTSAGGRGGSIRNLQQEEEEEEEEAVQTWTELGPPIRGTESSDRTGNSVSMCGDGTHIAVGTPRNDDNSDNNREGKVQVFTYSLSNAQWVPFGNAIYGEGPTDEVGVDSTSISLNHDGMRLAVGSGQNDAGAVDSRFYNAGHVRIYEYNVTLEDWVQLGVDIDGEARGDYMGFAVSLSGDGECVAVGAPRNDGGRQDSGQVRIYHYDETSMDWEPVGQHLDGRELVNRAGYSVSMSYDCSHVAFASDVSGSDDPGRGQVDVYRYDDNDGLWIQVGDSIEGESQYDRSGFAISLSYDGTRIAVGAPFYEGQRGYVRVYEYNGVSWTRLGEELDQDSANLSGYAVSMSSDGRIVAFGSPDDFSIDSFATESGEARVFELRDLSR